MLGRLLPTLYLASEDSADRLGFYFGLKTFRTILYAAVKVCQKFNFGLDNVNGF
jgi:hypothetical protein